MPICILTLSTDKSKNIGLIQSPATVLCSDYNNIVN